MLLWFDVCWCYGVVRLGGVVSGCRLKQCFSLHKDTTPPQQNHTVTPTHIEPEQYNIRNKSTKSRKLLKMDVLTFETCWAVNSEIIKQVTSSWSVFIQLRNTFWSYMYVIFGLHWPFISLTPRDFTHTCQHFASISLIGQVKLQWTKMTIFCSTWFVILLWNFAQWKVTHNAVPGTCLCWRRPRLPWC